MPKLAPVHWYRQNLSATHNPISVFKRELCLHLLGRSGQDTGMSVKVCVCVFVCKPERKGGQKVFFKVLSNRHSS